LFGVTSGGSRGGLFGLACVLGMQTRAVSGVHRNESDRREAIRTADADASQQETPAQTQHNAARHKKTAINPRQAKEGHSPTTG
jgi:hypothetical protein